MSAVKGGVKRGSGNGGKKKGTTKKTKGPDTNTLEVRSLGHGTME